MRTSMGSRLNLVRIAFAVLLAAAALFAVAALPATAHADNTKATVERINKNGDSWGIQKYSDIAKAFDEVKAWGKNDGTSKVTITLYDDFDSSSYGHIEFLGGKTYVLNLNGHIIDRGLVKEGSPGEGEGDGEVIDVEKNVTLTINGGTGDASKVEHKGYLPSHQEGYLWKSDPNDTHTGNDEKLSLYGGVITGGATNDKYGAGGIAMSDSGNVKVYLKNVTVAGNYADWWDYWFGKAYGYGGGVGMHGDDSTLELDNATIAYNCAEEKGGGVYVRDDSCNINLKNGSQISHNKALNYGGGIYADDEKLKVTLDNSKMSNNGHQAICFDDDDETLEVLNNSEISGNTYSGIRSTGTGMHLTFKNSTVRDNGYIAAVYITGDNTTIDAIDSTFCNNWDSWHHGGAFGLEGETTLNLKNSKIYGNSSAPGGGICCMAPSTINMDNSYIYNNTATLSSSYHDPVGGGIAFYEDSSGAMTLNMINGSSIYSNTGGGVYNNGYKLRIVSSDKTGTIRDNTTQTQFGSTQYAHNGGGICSQKGTLYVEGISITGNKTGGDGWYYAEGGGIYSKDTEFTLKDVTITGNTSRIYGGLFFSSTEYRAFTLQGRVIIEDNEYLYRWSSWGRPVLETGVSNANLSCALQTMCGGGSEDTYLKPTSRIGIDYAEGSLPRRISGNQAFMTKLGDAYKKVVFSDSDSRVIELDDDGYLYLKEGKSRFDLTLAYGDGQTATKKDIGRSNKVELKSADYPKCIDPADPSKGTYLLDYWTLETPNALIKTVKASAGMTELFMPYGDTKATAHYVEDATGAQLELADGNSWDKLGTKENVSVSSLAFTTCEGKQVTVLKSLLDSVVVESCSSADGTGSEAGLKKVTYTVKIPAGVFDELKLPVSSERVTSATTSVASNLGNKEDSACTVQAADGGIKLVATVTMGEQRTVTVTGLDVNKADTGQAAQIADVATTALVANNGTVTIATPAATGWNFTSWNTTELSGGATVKEQTANSITLENVTQDVSLGALYEPYVSAVDVTVAAPKVGDTLPTKFTSCRVTGTSFSGLDVTKSINEYGLSVVWKKYGSDEELDLETYKAEANTAYVGTATVTLGQTEADSGAIVKAKAADEKAYYYAFADNISVAVNGVAAITKRDTGAKKAVVTFTLATGKDKGFDHIVTDLSDVEVMQVADSSSYLPSSIEIALDKDDDKTKWKSCDVKWDSLPAAVGDTGEFTVTGKFTYEGSEYDVSRTFRLKAIGAPTSSIETGTYDKGQKLRLQAGSGWETSSDNVIKYCLVQGDVEKPAEDASYSDYDDETPIALDKNGTWTLFAYGQVDARTTETSRYVYKVRGIVAVDGGTAYVGDKSVGYALEGETVTIKADAAATRQQFAGWEIKEKSVELKDASASETTFTMPNNDVWVEATYKASAYLVTFDTGAWGSKVDKEEVKVGGKATKPTDPTRTNCTFEGWYADAACTEAYGFDSVVTADITLFAKWEVIEYTVEFDSNGGSPVESQKVVIGECADEPKAPTRSGYTFAGWQLDGKAYNFDDPVIKDITLTAAWQVIEDGTEYAKSVDVNLPDIVAGDELPATVKAVLVRYNGKQVELEAQLTWSTVEGDAVEAGSKAKAGTGYVVEATLAPSASPAVKYRSSMLVTFGGKSALGVSVGAGGNLEATYGFTTASKNIRGAELTLSKTKCAYDKNGCTPAATVTLDGKVLEQGADYTLRYQDSTKVGRAYAIVNGCGDYSGMLVAAYKIVPAKVTGVKVKAAGKGKLKVTWSKHKAQTDGFVVRYAVSKAALKAGKGTTLKVKGASKKRVVIKNLKSGKRAYVQVRAYKKAVGKTYRSAWSKVRSAKVK